MGCRVLAAAVAALALACGDRTSEVAAATAPDPVIDVRTQRVGRGSIAQRITAPGSLVARRESQIGAEVRGRIERIHVNVGDRVTAGQPLFEIDADPYRAALRQAEAGLDVARSQRLQLEADLRRTQQLHREQVVSEQVIERQASGLQVARAQERQAEEAVALARQEVERTVVASPYAGSIAARLADEGTTALVTPQTIVLVLQETAELEARASIPESERASVHVGDRALIHAEGVPAAIETTLSAVSDSIDPATRTYLVKARVPNPEHTLKAGVFARVEVLTAPRSDVLIVPREAIRTEDGETRVLAVREGRAVPVAVELGVSTEETAEVIAGLESGEEIVVGDSARTLAPGMRVRAVEADGKPAS
jgi:RND family efflux transporter MFP subunit